MGEGRSGRRVGEVVRRNVDGLHRGHRPLLGRGDALLEFPHLGGEVGLITHRGGHSPEQRRNLGAGLGESENIVDEEQHVLAFGVPEVLCNREAREADAEPRARGLGHLAVDQGGLRIFPAVGVDDAGLGHFDPQVVALTGAFSDTGEDRKASVLERHVVDQLHDDHGLADASAAEQTGLAALGVGLEKIDDLDSGFEHLGLGGLVHERRRLAVDRQPLVGLHRTLAVNRLAEHAEDPAESLFSNRDRDRLTEVLGLHPPNHAVGGLHRDAPRTVFTEVLRHLAGDVDGHHTHAAVIDDLDGVQDRREVLFGKLHVHHRADDRYHVSADLFAH